MPRLAQPAPQAAQIVVSLSDRIVPFGEPVPEATQYFDTFGVRDGQCVWEFY